MKVLVVAAHHDDLELGCGGTVAKLVDGGHDVFSLVMTRSGYSGSDTTVVRSDSDALDEGKQAAKILNYQLQHLDEDTFDIAVCDKNIRHILGIVAEHNIDTLSSIGMETLILPTRGSARWRCMRLAAFRGSWVSR